MGLPSFGCIKSTATFGIYAGNWSVWYQFLFCWRILEQYHLGEGAETNQSRWQKAQVKMIERERERIQSKIPHKTNSIAIPTDALGATIPMKLDQQKSMHRKT